LLRAIEFGDERTGELTKPTFFLQTLTLISISRYFRPYRRVYKKSYYKPARTYYKPYYPRTKTYTKSYTYNTNTNPLITYSSFNSHDSSSFPAVSASYLLQPATTYYNIEPVQQKTYTTYNTQNEYYNKPIEQNSNTLPTSSEASPKKPPTVPSEIPADFDPELAELADLLDIFPVQSQEPTERVAQPNNVVEVISKSENLKNLATLVTEMGLSEDLSTAPLLTIFAPSDKAFGKFRGTTMVKDLKRHIIGVKLPSSNIETGPAATLSGDVINLVKDSDSVRIEYNGQVINVLQADISASNGVIHVVDKVIQ